MRSIGAHLSQEAANERHHLDDDVGHGWRRRCPLPYREADIARVGLSQRLVTAAGWDE